ncbi:MAG: tetratricopeptide repeat protein [Phycisphaeraceae bacterium]|nr:tetratricopeptide repeat protein [Phycisphaeraceae bacterium]
MPHARLDRWFAAIIAVLSILVFFHTIDGDWVWDDVLQIKQNQQIQDPDLAWRALTTDVWSFRSATGTSESRYWRPSFIAWMIGVERVAGTEEATLWRASVVLLHAIASVLAYFVVRGVGFAPLWAAPVALIFALHPTKPESVAWVSGATDPILAVFLFTALICTLSIVRSRPLPSEGARVAPGHYLRRSGLWLIATLAFAGALGSKEVAVLFPGLVFAAAVAYRSAGTQATAGPDRFDRRSLVPALVMAMPFAAMSLAFLVLRRWLLGPDSRPNESFLPFEVNLYTLPRVGLFYLQQGFVPIRVSPFHVLSHQLKPDFEGFFLPAIGLVMSGLFMLWIVFGPARSRAAAVGLAMFALIIAPAAYVTNFPPPDQLVHDRYLYLPLLGLLLLVAALARHLTRRLDQTKVQIGALALGIVLIGAMAPYTMRYAEAWKSGLGMWGWGTRVAPGSAMSWQHYGLELAHIGRHDEAIQAFQRSLDIHVTPLTYLGLAQSLVNVGRLDEAERVIRSVVDRLEAIGSNRIEYFHALDMLATLRVFAENDVDGAVRTYARGLERLPNYRASLYNCMAVKCFTADRNDEALGYLLKARPLVDSDAQPSARTVYLHLGLVYLRQERLDEAALELEKFLEEVEGFDDRFFTGESAKAYEVLTYLWSMGKGKRAAQYRGPRRALPDDLALPQPATPIAPSGARP